MKALSTSIVIVVTAVVILVAALVILTIFGGGIGSVGTLSSAENTCRAAFQTACSTTGTKPVTWDVPTMRVTEGTTTVMKPCSGIVTCSCNSGTRTATC
jgi:hypothetical protein